MNYFELHIGDLTEATAHLSILEDGVYGRLLRKYYATERPLPADVGQVQRLVGARSKDERQAVEDVLREFFGMQDDGWHQSRCDAEIAAFHEKQVGREGAKEGAKERQRRARERRKALFETLRGHNIVPPYTTTTVELEAMLSRVTAPAGSQHVTPPVTRDVTATQTPDTKHQSPDSREESTRTATSTDAGRVCKALKGVGIGDVSPGHPDLLALISAGATDAEFESAGRTAVDRGKGFAYALGTLKRQRADAAHTAKTLHTGPMPTAPPPRQSATDRQIATTNALTGRDRDHDRQRAPAADTIDIDARVVP